MLAAAGLTAGCFQPLFGTQPSAATNSVRDKLQQIDVPVIVAPKGQTVARIAVALRNSLQYGLNGAAGANAPTYTLKVNVGVSNLSIIVDITSGRPDAQVASIIANYQLIEMATGKVVLNNSTFAMSITTFPARRNASPSSARSAMPKTAPPRSSPTPSGTGWHRTSSPAPEHSRWLRSKQPTSTPSWPAAIRRGRFVLVFGPDAGLVSERVNALIKASVDDVNDPFALARLEAEDLAAEPSRLVEEAQTIPLFGGRRAVRVKAGSRNVAPAVEALLALRTIECRVVIEAGDLRRNAPLRSLCEKAKNAAALPCYADDERARTRLIDDEMREAGLKLAPDARAMLIPLLGGDRQASRNEIAKLALYARGRDLVGVDDVAAVVSDASALALDDIVDATFAGRPAELETQLGKARLAGTSAGSILFAVQRQVAQLHKWRTAIETGSGFSLDAVQPPVNFRRKDAIAAALETSGARQNFSSP